MKRKTTRASHQKGSKTISLPYLTYKSIERISFPHFMMPSTSLDLFFPLAVFGVVSIFFARESLFYSMSVCSFDRAILFSISRIRCWRSSATINDIKQFRDDNLPARTREFDISAEIGGDLSRCHRERKTKSFVSWTGKLDA